MDMESYDAAMRDTAEEVRGLAKHLIDQVLPGIQSGATTASLDWDGKAGGMFVNVNQKFVTHFTNIAEGLIKVGTLIDTVADGHQYADSHNEKIMDMDFSGLDLAGDNIGSNGQVTNNRLSAMRGGA
ncbi:WXG100 family type VII secretion target [Catelliglobosispora koreensis]|uniref:WXG100 family type VII secretion target n=1 Tax=Catelliglobosispora koreensis TaxID=129052 RepID=UPI00039BE033|nr:hypothetical protein [Catelliglobosispora koreensis]